MQRTKETENGIPEIVYQQSIQDFDEVAIYFTKEEWDCLNEEEKKLYKLVMIDNYQTLRSLGLVNVKPRIVSMIERGEEPYVRGHQHPGEKTILINPSKDCNTEDVIVTQRYQRANHISSSTTSRTLLTSMIIKDMESSAHKDHLSNSHRNKKRENTGKKRVKKYGRKTIESQAIYIVAKKSFACSLCGKSFNRNSSLTRHQKIHTGEKPFACPVCGKCFTYKVNLVAHRKIHTGEKPFACYKCGKCFSRNSSLTKHQRFHRCRKAFACPDCGKCFTHTAKLLTHRRIHRAVNTFACLHCGEVFSQASLLTEHEKCHKEEMIFTRTDYGKCYTDENIVPDLRIHTKEKTFECSDCGICFGHTGEKALVCKECGDCFSQKANLIRHLRVHGRENLLASFECRKGFIHNANLISHKRVHQGEKAFACSEWDCQTEDIPVTQGWQGAHSIKSNTSSKPVTSVKSMDMKSSAHKDHLTDSHVNKHNEYTGTDHGKKCVKQNINTQVICHAAEKSFACSLCGKSFNRNSSLTRHQKIHTGEKPFACPVCGKCFTYKVNLVAHCKIHTGEKPFACYKCGKCFSRSSGLAKHQIFHRCKKEL